MAQAITQNHSVKFIKGVPYFVDSENNAYLFCKLPNITQDAGLIKIGIINGTSVVLSSDWQQNTEDCLKRFRDSLMPYERIEHTKVVKFNKKSTRTRSTAASTTPTPPPTAIPIANTNPTPTNIVETSCGVAAEPPTETAKSATTRRRKPRTKVQTATGQTS